MLRVLYAAHQQDLAGADHLPYAVASHGVDECVDLLLISRDLEHEGLVSHVDDVGAEDLAEVDEFSAVAGGAGHLAQTQLALDVDVIGVVDDFDHVDELDELVADLLEGQLVTIDGDRHAGDVGSLGRADREAIDVEPTASKQPRHPREDRLPATRTFYLPKA